MTSPGATEKTGSSGGSSEAFFARVYDELRRIAHARMREEQADQSLQTTELVHEAYLRLSPEGGGEWENRAQFFGAAAQAMRRILLTWRGTDDGGATVAAGIYFYRFTAGDRQTAGRVVVMR